MDGAAGSASETTAERSVFRDACRFVVDALEGGGKLITDQGGRTRWGISQRAYPTLDIEHLTRERAETLYHEDYWRPIRGYALPPALALCLFDTAVNHGPVKAVRLLQRALHLEVVDGVIGPVTVSAVKLARPQSGLIVRLLSERLNEYEWLARTDPTKHGASLHGWRNRILRLAMEAGRWRMA